MDISEIDSLDKIEALETFNQSLYAIIKNLNTLVKDEDILHFSYAYNDIIRANHSLIIDQFNMYVLEFYDKIKKKDIDFFLDEKSFKKYGDSSSITKIFKFKKLFEQLSKKHKDELFDNLDILCQLGVKYFKECQCKCKKKVCKECNPILEVNLKA